MAYEWLLFDADGTLFDYVQAEGAALARTFTDMGVDFDPAYRPVYHAINHALWLAFEQGRVSQEQLRVLRFARLLDTLGLPADPIEMSARYLPRLAEGTFLIRGAAELLASAVDRYRLALITNGLTDVQRPRLALSGLAPLFDHIIISEEVGSAKPAAPIFDHTMARLGHPARAQVLMIGDSLSSDMRGAVEYGLDACWFNPDRQRRPRDLAITYEIQSLADLWPLLNLPGRPA